MGGWDGRSSSPVGLPGLRAVVLWSFGGLPFVGSGGERRSYVVSGGGHCRSSVVVGALLSVFADVCPRLWVLMVADWCRCRSSVVVVGCFSVCGTRPRSWVLIVGDWWPLSIERGSGGLLSVFVAPVLVRGS